jgi:hypothetical protein
MNNFPRERESYSKTRPLLSLLSLYFIIISFDEVKPEEFLNQGGMSSRVPSSLYTLNGKIKIHQTFSKQIKRRLVVSLFLSRT